MDVKEEATSEAETPEVAPKPTTAEVGIVIIVDDLGQWAIGASGEDPWEEHSERFSGYACVRAA